jgi:hypothetical protein
MQQYRYYSADAETGHVRSSRSQAVSSSDYPELDEQRTNEEDLLIRKGRIFDESVVDIYGWQLPRWWPLTQASTILLLRAGFLLCAFLLFTSAFTSWEHSADARGELATANEIHWTASRLSYGTLSSLSYLPWDAVVEPYHVNEANITFVKLNHIAHNYGAVEGDLVTNNQHINVTWSINGKLTALLVQL